MQNFTAECNFGILNMLLDNTSFENLYYEYSDRLCNYASHYLSDRAMAGDIVQDAYIHLWEKYKGKESEEWHPLLFTMVRNRCIDRLRHLEFSGTRAFVTPLSEVCEDRLYHSDFHSDSKTIYGELSSQISNVLDRLPEKCREVFVMSRFRGMKNREIASSLGISEKAVEKHISRALRVFKEELHKSGYLGHDLRLLLLFLLSA